MAGAAAVKLTIVGSKIIGGTSMEMISYIAGGTIYKGSPVILTSGLAVASSSVGATVMAVVGIAAEGALVTERVNVIPALPNVIFEGTLESDTTAGYTSIVTNRGLTYGIWEDTVNHVWYVNVDDTAQGIAYIDEYADGTFGVVKARVRFHIEGAATVWAT